MLPKEERKAMLLRLFNDESELVDHAKDRERAAAESRVVNEEVEVAEIEEKKDDESLLVPSGGDNGTNGAEPQQKKEVNGVTNGAEGQPKEVEVNDAANDEDSGGDPATS
jgi:hypothetical protein